MKNLGRSVSSPAETPHEAPNAWDTLTKFSRAYVPLDSEVFKRWWWRIQESSSLTLGKPLSQDAWQYLIMIFMHVDVSQIQHLVLSLPQWEEVAGKMGKSVSATFHGSGHRPPPIRTLSGEAIIGIEQLGAVLGTGRFSGLKTLRLFASDAFVLQNSDQSGSIAEALRTGQFRNLQDLSLPVCDASAILEALAEGGISQLSSFSVINIAESLDAPQKETMCKNLYAVLTSGSFRLLQHLDLSNGVIDGINGWKVFTGAIESGFLPSMKSLCLSNCALQRANLADLVGGHADWFSSLEILTMDHCGISSEQLCIMVDAIMKVPKIKLSLRRLGLHDNSLGNRAVGALVSLAIERTLPNLEELDLSMNVGMDLSAYLVNLTEAIQRGWLPSLHRLIWVGNPVSDAAAEAIAQAYYDSESFIAEIDLDWSQVFDISLRTKVKEYRDRNVRLAGLKEKLKEELQDMEQKDELQDMVPLNTAKVFLCGYPEVGKTKLRKTLLRYLGIRTRFLWEKRPNLFKEPRTRGIELSRIEEKKISGNNLALVLWDLAGQEEYHVLHGAFLADLGFAGGKATTFVLVFRSQFDSDVEAKLLYWLRFVSSSSLKHVRRHVVIVLNCFDGRHCTESDKRCWMALIRSYATLFCDLLDISRDPFIIDVRIASSVKPLKDHLFYQARMMLQDVEVPRVCFELQEELKGWSKGERNKHLPILTWQAFERGTKLKHFSAKALRIGASYLHEMGEIIYFEEKEFAEPGSENRNRSLLVPDPEWFCRKVVGELLLPKEMLDGGSHVKVRADGSISVIFFKTFFEHLLAEGTRSDDVISMLELVGLCYRKGRDKIVVPALIREDDSSSIDWQGKGFHGVMGRCFAIEDQERGAIPVTLFRRLQVDLAQDPDFGGRGDSEYRAGKSFSNFKVGELLVLIEFDVDHLDPTYDRIDVLVKSMIKGDPTEVRLAQVKCICTIMQKVEVLCFSCCPGLRYDIKVIKPSNASDTLEKMTQRKLISLREIKDLLLQGKKYASWQLNGNPMELKTFLSDGELRGFLGVKALPVEAAEEPHALLEGVEVRENPGVSTAEDREASLKVVELTETPGFSASEDRNASLKVVELTETPGFSTSEGRGASVKVVELTETPGFSASKDRNASLKVVELTETPGFSTSEGRGASVKVVELTETPGFSASEDRNASLKVAELTEKPGFSTSEDRDASLKVVELTEKPGFSTSEDRDASLRVVELTEKRGVASEDRDASLKVVELTENRGVASEHRDASLQMVELTEKPHFSGSEDRVASLTRVEVTEKSVFSASEDTDTSLKAMEAPEDPGVSVVEDPSASLEAVELTEDPGLLAAEDEALSIDSVEVAEDPDVSPAEDEDASMETVEVAEIPGVFSDVMSEQDNYYDCEQDALALGLMTEDSLQTWDQPEDNSLNARGYGGFRSDGSTFESHNRDLAMILHAIQDVKQAIWGEGQLLRQHVDKGRREQLSEIRQKHDLLVRRIQAQEAFSIEQKEASVPRYMFLSQKQGNSRVWISLTEAFQSAFYLHLLCEAHFDDGFLHEVRGQAGIELTKNREWLQKISPWLQRSLQVAVMVAQHGGTVNLPGICGLIPNFLSQHGEALAKALESAATMLPAGEVQAGPNEVPPGTRYEDLTGQTIKLSESFIAQETVKDLMDSMGHAEFAKKIGLRKVLLRPKVHLQIGSSEQALVLSSFQPHFSNSFRPHYGGSTNASVCWICEDCYRQYGNRVIDI